MSDTYRLGRTTTVSVKGDRVEIVYEGEQIVTMSMHVSEWIKLSEWVKETLLQQWTRPGQAQEGNE